MIEYVGGGGYGALPQQNVHGSGAGMQDSPVIARLAGGGFVVGWISDSAFYVQRYDAQGQKTGGEQLIAGYAGQPALVGLSSGGFAAAWSASGVYARTFDASGNAVSAVFSASTATPRPQMQQPALGAQPDGHLVIAWTDLSSGGTNIVNARIFDGAGTGLTGELSIAATQSFNSYFPKVAVQADGDFVVAWTGPYTAPSSEIFFTAANARLFDSAGNPKSGLLSSHDYQSVPGFHDGLY